MIKEYLFLVGFLLVLVISIAVTPTVQTQKNSSNGTNGGITIPQLATEARADSETMVLLNAPPVLPADHTNFWNPEIGYESCMVCHANPDTRAPQPPNDHYIKNEIEEGIFRDNCLQCHAVQEDANSTFIGIE